MSKEEWDRQRLAPYSAAADALRKALEVFNIDLHVGVDEPAIEIRMSRQAAAEFARKLSAIVRKAERERKKKPMPKDPIADDKPENGPYCGFLRHDETRWRWWQSDWMSDQFDIIDRKELDKRIADARGRGLPVINLEFES